MRNKLLAALMVLLIVITLFPVPAYAMAALTISGVSSPSVVAWSSGGASIEVGYDSTGKLYVWKTGAVNLNAYDVVLLADGVKVGQANGWYAGYFSSGYISLGGYLAQNSHVYRVIFYYGGVYYYGTGNLSVSGVAQVPGQVTGLTVTGGGSNSPGLSWSAVAGATSYNVYDNGSKIASGITSTSFTVSALAPGSSHSFQVSGVSSAGEGLLSTAVSYAVLLPAPTGLSVSGGGSSSGYLYWSAVTFATSYNVYDNGTQISTGLTGASYSFANFAPGSSHTFQISAVGANGEGYLSAPVVYNVVNYPSAVSGVQYTPTDIQTGKLTWAANPSSELVSGYNVFDGGKFVAAVTVTGLEYNFSGLTQGQHSFQVAGVNGVGQGALSAGIQFTSDVPLAPSGVAFSSDSYNSGTLSWASNSADQFVTGYNVFDNGNFVTAVSGTSYHFASLSGGSHSFQVQAANALGPGPVSSNDVFDVLAAPANVWAGYASASGFTVGWQSVSQATSYNVYLDGSLYKNVSVGTTTLDIVNLQPSTQYTVQVSAVDNIGEGALSAPVKITTLKEPAALSKQKMIADVLQNTGLFLFPVGSLLALALGIKRSPWLIFITKFATRFWR